MDVGSDEFGVIDVDTVVTLLYRDGLAVQSRSLAKFDSRFGINRTVNYMVGQYIGELRDIGQQGFDRSVRQVVKSVVRRCEDSLFARLVQRFGQTRSFDSGEQCREIFL